MQTSRKRRKKLNKMGKLTIGLLIALTMISTLFLTEHFASKNVDAEKKEAQVQQTVKQTSKSAKKTEKDNVEAAIQPKSVDPKKEETKVDTGKTEEVTKKKEAEETNKSQKAKTPPAKGKVVYLTFDDGPSTTASRKILNLLDKYDAKATFFMLEPNMRKNKDIVIEMAEKGHTLGVHGVTHEVSKIYQSPKSFVGEMNQAISYIEDVTGIRTHLVRAPYGSRPYVTSAFKQAADKEEFILWDWNIDTVDWKQTGGGFVDAAIRQTMQLDGKEPLVVLMHEKDTTAAHLERLLKYYKDNGYDMRALNESMQPIQFK
ncbi:MAG TPA: polysaccharide deacetylase family protein [Cerasibacillus sp.]